MPFQSKAQQRFMYLKHPKIAKEWQVKYGQTKNLPEKKKSPWLDMGKDDKKKETK